MNESTTTTQVERLVMASEATRYTSSIGRIPYWDFVRGVAILLVILGHVAQYGAAQPGAVAVFRIVYSFHMPLFMFISGHLAYSTFRPTSVALTRKFLALVVPFLAWAVVYFFGDSYGRIKAGGAPHWGYFYDLLCSPDWGLWFIWILFLLFFLLYVVRRLGCREVLAVLVLYVWLRILDAQSIHGMLGVSLLVWQMPYFFGGYMIARWLRGDFAVRWYQGVAVCVAYVLLVPYWNKSGEPSFYPFLGLSECRALTEIYNWMIPFLGISAVLYVCSLVLSALEMFSVGRAVTFCLRFLGCFTIEIYVCHKYFITILIGATGFLGTAVSFAFSTLVCLCFSLVFIAVAKEVPLLNKVLFGRFPVASSRDTSLWVGKR